MTILHYLLALCFALCMPLAHAEEHIAARAYFEDTGATLDFEQVRTRPFQPFDDMLNKGYRDSAFWVRLRIHPGAPTPDGKLIVRILPAYLDEIRLFDPAYPSETARVSGDRAPITQDAYPSLHSNFSIPQSDRPRDIWLRIKTTSTTLLHVEVLSLEQALQEDRAQEIFAATYLAFQLFFLLWGLSHWLGRWESLLGYFVLKQALGTLHALALFGFLRLYWPDQAWPFSPDIATSLLVLLFVAAATRFDYQFLRELTPNRLLLRGLGGLMLFTPVFLLLLLLGHARQAMSWNMIIVLIEPLLALATALSIPPRKAHDALENPVISKRHAVALYAVIVMSISLAALPSLGLIHALEWTLYSFLMYTFLTGLTVVVLLQIRARKIEDSQFALQIALRTLEQKAAMEEEKRIELGHILSMLTHELKTPLAVVHMVLGAADKSPRLVSQAQAAIHDMDAMIERCTQADRMESNRITPVYAPCSMAEILHQILAALPMRERVQVRCEPAPPVNSDAALLQISIGNLIDNALKYGAPDTEIEVGIVPHTAHDKPGVQLIISNLPGSAGWPDPDQVFSKYYRHPKARKASGSGLGLFLVAGLTHRLGGEIAYTPTPTHVRFKLWLPL